MNKKLCVVGAGYWGSNHIKTLNEIGALKGIVEHDKELLYNILKRYPKVKGYLNIEDALDDQYHGYTIATPAETHYEIAKKIILAKKHVLIEKPMTLLVREAENLVKIAKDNNVNIMVGHVLLFHPAILKIKEIVENGDIGELQYIYSNRLNLGKIRSEENVFWSFAQHDIAIFQFLTNSFPKNIHAEGSTFVQKGVPDSTLTHLEYENGVKGHIFVSWLHPFKEHRLVVIGSEAMISFEDSQKGKPLKLYSKKFDLVKGVPEKIDGPVQSIHYKEEKPLTAELNYFINSMDCIDFNLNNGEQGLDVIRILTKASQQIKA